jgi:hypothetical protein
MHKLSQLVMCSAAGDRAVTRGQRGVHIMPCISVALGFRRHLSASQ